MRRLVAVLLVALLALSLVGCGGGGEEEAAAPPEGEAAAPAPAPVPVAGTTGPAYADRSALSTETFVPFRAIVMPDAVKSRLEEGQAMVLFFYDTSQLQTDEVRGQINAAVKSYSGAIDLLAFDMGKYTSVDSSGNVKVSSSALAEDKSAQTASAFAREVGVNQLPYILIVDNQGYEIFHSIGFIDDDLLDRQVERATR